MSIEPLVDVVTGEVIDVALTAEQARSLTDRIRQTLHVGHDLIVEAFRGSAWSVLGYSSWDAYCAGEFAGARMVRLDREQRREIVAEMRRAGMSQRAVASGLGINHSTVVRDEAHLSAGAPRTEPVEYAPVTGLDGKTYTKPSVPTAQPVRQPSPAQKRRPLIEGFADATYDLNKVTERLERLCADDRFPQNAEQVATKNRGDLLRAAEALAGVLDRLNHNH